MLTSGFYHNMMTGKRLEPLAYTHKPASDWLLFMPRLWRECANILNKHTRLYAAVLNSRRLGQLGNLERKAYIMNTQITTYNFNQNQVRTQILDGNPWFCLADACGALGLSNSRQTKTQLSKAGVTKTYISYPSGAKELTFINEPNLYRLIFRSNKPQAQAFADWVYSEVLPSIRRTGGYGVPAVCEGLSSDDRKTIGGIVKRCCEVVIKEQLDGRTITKTVDALSDFDFPAMPEKEELNPHLVRDALRAMIAQIGFRMDYRDACYSSLEKLRGLFLALQATFERYDTIRMETLFACSMMDGNGRYDKKQALSRIIELNQIAPKGTLKLKQAIN